jgi:hypothetical protein
MKVVYSLNNKNYSVKFYPNNCHIIYHSVDDEGLVGDEGFFIGYAAINRQERWPKWFQENHLEAINCICKIYKNKAFI